MGEGDSRGSFCAAAGDASDDGLLATVPEPGCLSFIVTVAEILELKSFIIIAIILSARSSSGTTLTSGV
jgi:hypothetical protein